LLVDDLYKVEAKIEPFMMNRIVDVKKAFELSEYPNIGEHSLSIKITDTIADWNNGVWHLYLSQGNIRAEKGSDDDDFDATISIQELSRMIIGYAGGKELLDICKINAVTQEAGDFICEVFIKKPTYINNMY
jgi:predicted acetyltransferase